MYRENLSYTEEDPEKSQGYEVPNQIPYHILNHQLGWLLGHIWTMVHCNNRMFMCLVLGKPGIGKSWLSIALANFLDTNSRGVPLFKQENICFSPRQFTNIFSQQFHKGTAVVLDDAGLSLYNRESMTREVINLTKMAQSMRFKNPIVFFNLPHDAMIDKNILRLIGGRIIVKGYSNNRTRFAFQLTQTYPTSDKIYYPYPKVKTRQISRNGIEWFRDKKITRCSFERGPDDLLNEYEDRKAEYMTSLYLKYRNTFIKTEPQSFSIAYHKVRKNYARYQRRGSTSPVDPYRILIDRDIEIDSMSYAKKIAELINAEFGLFAKVGGKKP